MVEEINLAQGAKKDANKLKEESCKCCRDIAVFCTAPVAGPIIFTLLWLMSVFLVTVYFGWLCWSSSSAWYKPVTFIEQDAKTELEYPDIYMCLPSQYASQYLKFSEDEKLPAHHYYIAAGVDKTTYDEVSKEERKATCGEHRRASFIKVDPLSSTLAETTEDDLIGGCPIKNLTQSHLHTTLKDGSYGKDVMGASFELGCWDPPTDSNQCSASIPNGDWADGLADLLPKTEKNGEMISAACLRYEMKEGAKQLYDEHGRNFLFTRHLLGTNAQGDPESVFMVAYLSKAGVAPYDGEVITATQIYFPGPPSVAVAFLRIEEVTDLTKQHANDYANQVLGRISGATGTPITYYRYHMWSRTESSPVAIVDGADGVLATEDYNPFGRPLGDPAWPAKAAAIPGSPQKHTFMLVKGCSACDHVDAETQEPWAQNRMADLSQAGIGFVYEDFIVRKITIRLKTFSEIFAEVGGLWAGCAALLWLVWKKSGYLRKKADGSTGEEMMIFRYILCKSWKDEWLYKGAPKDDPTKPASTAV